MKNIHVAKRWVIFPSFSFPLLPSLSCSLSSCKLFPTEERKQRGALVPSQVRGFFTEESMATTTWKKSIREEEHFLSMHTQHGFYFCFWRSRIRVLGYSCCNPSLLLSFHAVLLCVTMTLEGPFCFLLLAYCLCYMTSTKNSPAFPTAMRSDWREAVSSGGTEERSLPGGAPGAAVDRCCGWGGRPGGP